jgi:phage baseplate assembly protein W
MAVRLPNKHPLDINKRVAVGVSIPFNGKGTTFNNLLYTASAGGTSLGPNDANESPTYSTGNSVFNSTYTTVDQIKSNIINYVLTNKGERVLNPNFGSNLRKFIFENITESNLRALEIKLTNDIKNNFPSVDVISITLSPAYEDNAIQLDIVYSIYGSEAQNIKIVL